MMELYTVTVYFPFLGAQTYPFTQLAPAATTLVEMRDEDIPAILTFPHSTPAGPVGQAQKGLAV